MALVFESQYEELMSVNPGLFHLQLNLLVQTDTETLQQKRKLLELALQQEHSTTHLVLNNLIALISKRLPRRHHEVRKILEGIHSKVPKHLNTVANLQELYKELHRDSDAKRCELLKDRIVQSLEPEDIESKATCILEQGYALTFEDITNHEGMAKQKLKDSLNILTSEYDKSSGDKKHYLSRALYYTQQAYSSVLSSMKCKRPDDTVKRRKESIAKFIFGLKLLKSVGKENSLEYVIWEFFLGMASNRLDYSIYEGNAPEKYVARRSVNEAVVNYFWETISKLCEKGNIKLKNSSRLKLYVGRSYAYIGHILTTRKDIICDLQRSSKLPCFKNLDLIHLLQNTIECFHLAMEFYPHDTVVLNRYGRALQNISLLQKGKTKWNTLCHSYDLLNESLRIQPHNNWFAYSIQMLTCRDIASLDHRNSNEWLLEAKHYGLKCLNSIPTEKDLCCLAKICQMLAKFPNHKQYGPKYVNNYDYIHDAVNFLNYAIQLGGYRNWTVAYNLALCLYEIEEYRPAIQWMKIAMELSRKDNPTCLTRLGEYIFAFHNDKSTTLHLKVKPDYLYQELKFIIGLGKTKFSDIGQSLKSLCKYQQKEMLSFLEYLFKSEAICEMERDIIISSLRAFQEINIHRDNQMLHQKLNDQFRKLPTPVLREVREFDRDGIYTPSNTSLPISMDTAVQYQDFKYDFFLSHSNVDKDWVNGYLLHHLETKLDDNDTAFKGCIADRDFIPGETINNNIVVAVENSCKIILIITPNFVRSRWCDFEVNQALESMLNKKKQENCIIPILLEDVNMEEDLRNIAGINFLDLTNKKDHLQGIMKVKEALISKC